MPRSPKKFESKCKLSPFSFLGTEIAVTVGRKDSFCLWLPEISQWWHIKTVASGSTVTDKVLSVFFFLVSEQTGQMYLPVESMVDKKVSIISCVINLPCA